MKKDYVYYIGSDAFELDLQEFISNDIPDECGQAAIQVTLTNSEFPLPFHITEDTDSFSLVSQDVLRVQTNDLTFLGENQLSVQAVLAT